jgi:hypothetical protein
MDWGDVVWGQKGLRLASGTFPPQKTNNEGSLSSSYTKPLMHQPASRTLVDCDTLSTLENIIPFKLQVRESMVLSSESGVRRPTF